MSKKNNKATSQQMKEIDDGIKKLDLGENFSDFARKLSDDSYRAEFAKSLTKNLRALDRITRVDTHDGTYQPSLSQDLFQNINMNPHIATSEQLEKWLMSPSDWDEQLRSLSQYLSYAVGQYNALISLSNTSKAFNYVLLPVEYDIGSQVKTESYKESYKKACETLRKINVKSQLAKVDLQVLYDGVGFYYKVETTEEITLYQLPTSYCYITAPWTYGYRFAFDLSYFDRYSGVEKIAIPELAEAYKDLIKARKEGLAGEKLASIQYYAIEPNKGWCFTFDPIHPDKVPPFASSMMSALDILSYRQLLKDKAIFELYKVLALKIPLQKDNQKMAITYAEASAIRDVIQRQLPDNVTCYASPFESEAIDTNQIDNLGDIVNLGSISFSSSSGINEGLIGGGDFKQATALQFCYSVFFQRTSAPMYRQYENWINWVLKDKVGVKFEIHMFGSTARPQDDINMYSNIVKGNNFGMDFLFASMGLEPFNTLSMLQLDKELGYKELMEPLQSMFQSSGKSSGDGEGSVGRPRKEESELAESGARSRDYESTANT